MRAAALLTFSSCKEEKRTAVPAPAEQTESVQTGSDGRDSGTAPETPSGGAGSVTDENGKAFLCLPLRENGELPTGYAEMKRRLCQNRLPLPVTSGVFEYV